MESNSYKNYIYPTGGGFSPIFSAPISGTYQIFLQNLGNKSVAISGSYAF